MAVTWVNGRFDGEISPHDAGFLLGHGVFETLGAFRGNIPLWDLHMARLEHAARTLRIPWQPPPELPSRALSLLARNPEHDVLRITLTAGSDHRPTWCMTTRQRESPGAQQLHLHRVGARRDDPLATIKTTARAFHVLARQTARAAGADDALLVDSGDQILETTCCNVFVWLNHGLCTPPLDGCILPGIARAALISQLAYLGVPVEESQIPVEALARNNGMFTTNAVHGPRPATLDASRKAALAPVVVEAWLRAISEPRRRIRRPGDVRQQELEGA